MTREEVTEVEVYCQEHSLTYKARLEELGIPYWKFHDAKGYYKQEDLSRCGNQGNFIPVMRQMTSSSLQPVSRSHHKKPPIQQAYEASSLSVELQTPGGTLMRIQGEMSASVLKEIILAANGYVQP